MLKSEVQHQFWVTKKVVERKLGTKEDDCIVSSDAELDSKIDLFKSISDSCNRLYRIIDQYQERLCVLAQEENTLGKFLKEAGKNSNTSGKVMICAGKAISYCGQQRMTIRPTLLRLFHEVETFRERAIQDTQYTIMLMERERTEYRATLSWMKSTSNELDPDTGRGLEKFRKAQAHVRSSKEKFDRLTLDCLQKIDLLAAARCNMFSHALVGYMAALTQFATKSTETFNATAQALSTSTQYNFCILKDLADTIQQESESKSTSLQNVTPIDSDQMLFFLDEYSDNKKENINSKNTEKSNNSDKKKNDWDKLIEINSLNENKDTNSLEILKNPENTNLKSKKDNFKLGNFSEDFAELTLDGLAKPPSFMPSQLLLNEMSLMATSSSILEPNVLNEEVPISSKETNNIIKGQTATSKSGTPVANKNKSSILDFFNRPSTSKSINNSNINEKFTNTKNVDKNSLQKQLKANSKKDISSWFELFSELDPLANPDALAKKFNGNNNSQAT